MGNLQGAKKTGSFVILDILHSHELDKLTILWEMRKTLIDKLERKA